MGAIGCGVDDGIIETRSGREFLIISRWDHTHNDTALNLSVENQEHGWLQRMWACEQRKRSILMSGTFTFMTTSDL